MYGNKKLATVNEVRLEMFLNKYKQKKENASLTANIKAMDAEFLPPCLKVLLHKIKRSSIITNICKVQCYMVLQKSV